MKTIIHPGKRINDLTEANYQLRRKLLIARQHLSSANHRLDMAQKELSVRNYDMSSIPPIPMTKQVLGWITEFGVPWETLYCPECKSWLSELDNSFPYHLECSVCKCDENGGDDGQAEEAETENLPPL